ncbi:MAG: YegS/Rv2252/BmrU family lipid kinase [Candidatus Heimdallarchaeota archaeon]|nr:YegS/Rv2252/BmrU family lipid kinase [Candidatus Heimdallarchaeota archaeon]
MKIICNPTSYAGKSRKNWPRVVKALKEAGLDFEVEWTKEPLDAIRITKESIEDHDIICAYGGDGTINEIVTAIGQTGFKTTLGILAAGRGNDNAFSLRLTNYIDDLVEMLQAKEVRRVDCIEIDGGKRYCVGVAGAGIDALVAEKVIGKSTRISYSLALVQSFFSYRPRHMHIDIDDGRVVRDLKSLSTMICNGQRVGNKKMVAPNAMINDGLLDIVVIGNTGIVESLIASAGLKKGTHINHPKVEVLRGAKATITTNSPKRIPVHSMGEMIDPLPHTFICRPQALKTLKMPDQVIQREGWTDANVFLENQKK